MIPFHIVLHEPEQPGNTANIGRTCMVGGAHLHLIQPLGFILSDKMIKRAGMDYWDRLDKTLYLDWEDFKEKNPGVRIWYATTKAEQSYTDVEFKPGDYIMFGAESAGIPEEILREHPERCIRIPMMEGERSMNLSNSVAVVLYEALRQNDFAGLEKQGELHGDIKWSDVEHAGA